MPAKRLCRPTRMQPLEVCKQAKTGGGMDAYKVIILSLLLDCEFCHYRVSESQYNKTNNVRYHPARGQFWRPAGGILSRSSRERVEFCTKISELEEHLELIANIGNSNLPTWFLYAYQGMGYKIYIRGSMRHRNSLHGLGMCCKCEWFSSCLKLICFEFYHNWS